MTLAAVRAFLAEHAPDVPVLETDTSTATVALAAAAYGVEPGRIAKTLAYWLGDEAILVVMRGDARVDNRRFKDAFGRKAKMLDGEAVVAWTGHPVGGVCPFGLARPMRVFADRSLRAFDEVVPAAGSTHSAVRIAPERLAALVRATWVDVAQAVESPIEQDESTA
jgi:prolyl-tRNA editing enzyme YbaK/EbsC (Cys-tRNA(Pro) deacylase)